MKTILSAVIGAMLALSVMEAGAQAKGAERKVELAIEQQSLADALNEWAKQTGLQLVSPSSEMMNTKLTPRIKGTYSPQRALEELLKGTTLTYEWVSDRAVAIREKSPVVPAALQTIGEDQKAATVPIAQFSSESWGERWLAASDQSPTGGGPSAARGTESGTERLDELEEVVVTGTYIRGAAPIGSSLTVYGRDDIDRSGAGSVAQFLRMIPQNLASIDAATSQVRATGNDMSSNAWFGATVNLHGLGSGATLILLNGQRIAPAGGEGEFVDVSLIPLSAIDRIEVLSDGASAIYGADAVAGVVNFVMRRDYQGAETTIRVGDSTQGGSSEITASQLLGTRWLGGSAMVVYEYQDQDALLARQRDFVPVSESGVAGEFTLLPQQRRNGVFATANHALGDRTGLFAQAFWSKRDFDQTSLIGDLGAGRTETYIEGHADQLGGSIGVTQELPFQWQLEVVAGQSRLEQDQEQRNVAQGVVQPLNFVSRVTSLDARMEGPVFVLPAGAVRTSIGVSGRREGMNVAARGPTVPQFALERDVFSGYGEVLIPLVAANGDRSGPRLALSLATRYDHYSDFGSATQPKVGLSWAVSQTLTLRGSSSRSYKAPTLIQKHDVGDIYQLISIPNAADPDGFTHTMLFDGFGNTELQPERARSVSVGFDWKPLAATGLSVSATYFKIKFSDRIAGPPLVGGTLAIYDEPAVAPFISREVDQAEIDRILAEEVFENFSGPDFDGSVDPHLTEAFFDFHPHNIAATKESGLDFSADYAFGGSPAGTVGLFIAGTKLFKLDYQVTPTSPVAKLLNKTYRPMDLRLRTGANWTRGDVSVSATLNYSDGYENDLLTPVGSIDSWLTGDLQIRYEMGKRSEVTFLRDTTLSLSILNVTDEDPPSVPYEGFFANFNYDSANASPRGRFISLQAVKRW